MRDKKEYISKRIMPVLVIIILLLLVVHLSSDETSSRAIFFPTGMGKGNVKVSSSIINHLENAMAPAMLVNEDVGNLEHFEVGFDGDEKSNDSNFDDRYCSFKSNRNKSNRSDGDRREKNSCIDYELLEAKYKILDYDICTEPSYEWKHEILEEYFLESNADFLEKEQRLIESGTSEGDIVPTTFDYHVFDFNDDGLEDFLLCTYGWGYLGSAGHGVSIIVQEEAGKLRSAGDFILRLGSDYPLVSHSGLAVLEEKDNGFYALAVSEYSRILRYDEETDRYGFHEEYK